MSTWTVVSTPAGGSAVFSTPSSQTTLINVDQPGTYTVQYNGVEGPCSFEDQYTLVVDQPLEILSEDINCLLDGTIYNVSLVVSGTEPIFINGELYNGSLYVSNDYASGDIYNLNVTDDNGCSIILQGVGNCGCTSDAGTMSIDLIEICGDGQAIAQHDANEVLDGNDGFTYVLHDGPNNFLGNIFDTDNTGVFDFNPSLQYDQIYYISYVVGNDVMGMVDLNDPCLSVAVGQPVIWFEQPMPVVPLDIGICDMQIELEATTNAGNIFDWQVISQPSGSNAIVTNNSSLITNVVFDGAGFYEIVFTASNVGCIGQDTIVVEVFEGPGIINYSEDCNSGFYTISFEIDSDFPDFSINGISQSSNTFTSTSILSGDSYSFEIEDSNGCTTMIQGAVDCDCTSDAGTMDNTLLESCGNQDTFEISINGDSFMDNDDIGVYILHDGSGASLGDIIRIQDSNMFEFDIDVQFDVVYYVSYVVGNPDVSGTIDLNDPCLSVAEGQPVVWLEQPMPVLPADIGICDLQIELEATTNAGNTYDWQVISQPLGGNAIVSNSSSLITTINFDVSGFYEIVFTAANSNCIGQDTIVVEVFESPSIINYSEDCNSGFYTISFEIDSDFPDFLINGISQSSNTFTSASILSGDSYSFEIEDNNGCATMIQGAVDCDCTSDAGTMNNVLLESCGNQDTFEISINGDSFLDNDDIGVYILHDGSGAALGDIIRIQDSNMFEFDSDVQFDVIYYVSYVVGNSDGLGTIDLNDTCLSVAVGTPIRWRSIPLSEYQDSISICDGQLVVSSNEIGDNISELFINQLQGPVTANIGGNVNSVTIDFEIAGNYLFEYNFSDGLCQNIDSLYVNYQPLVISDIVEICNPDNATYQVSFSITSGFEPFSVNGNLITGNSFTSAPILSGDNYSFLISDGALCDSIVLDGILSCGCENDAGDLDNSPS